MSGPVPGVDGVRSALVRLRTRTGLSAERLRSTEVGVRPILDLPVVRQIVNTTGKDEPEAALDAVRRIADQLPTEELVIVDMALSLGLLADRFPDAPEIETLYAADVGERRDRLVELWEPIHRLLGVDLPDRHLTVRALRSSLETRAIAKLAELCVSSSVLDVALPEPGKTKDAATRAATVSVIGSAVVDHIYVVDHIPSPGSSTPLISYETHPGGKGLNHAVANARLGMDVHMITAVGDDLPGQMLLDYMSAEGMRLNLVKMVPNAKTPVVGVFMTRNGGAVLMPWMNEGEIRLDPADFHTHSLRNVLEASDAVVITFEQPMGATREVLRVVSSLKKKPLIVVRPSPPIASPQFLYEHFADIDYLVGTQWELRELLSGATDEITMEALASSLLVLGVHGVCITEEFGCMVRSEHLKADVARFPTALRDTPGAREAFSAALIHRLLLKDRKIDQSDLEWATAAMTAAQSFGGVADSMPMAQQVDRVLKVTPEHEAHD
ncbi:PfkB family carbohydrate kinase [Amycolatopsis pittospori]|uniref:PfkB family carbohydrate kinase n=1 Tax=Amycolatopsis pittospori TaxID=2749434 RepID=UPI0015F05D35|nr:PfkB family carbohydrate kinase [Amycolatopsis pittospori]